MFPFELIACERNGILKQQKPAPAVIRRDTRKAVILFVEVFIVKTSFYKFDSEKHKAYLLYHL